VYSEFAAALPGVPGLLGQFQTAAVTFVAKDQTAPGAAPQILLDTAPAEELSRRCTSCSTKKAATQFTIGKVTCDACCIKKRKLSKERTKNKQDLKTNLVVVTARCTLLEEENRQLRAGATPVMAPVAGLQLDQVRRTGDLEEENRMLRQQLLEQHELNAQHQARFEHVKKLLGWRIVAPRDTEEQAQDALALLARVAEQSPQYWGRK